MTLEETDRIIDYFYDATPEALELQGVDPSRFPPVSQWRRFYQQVYEQPIEQRSHFMVSWLNGDRFVGFSVTDSIKFGEQAHMHLHIVEPSLRNSGIGAACVKASVEIYFQTLQLKRLFCEPHAFNVAPNRTVQKAGFKFVKTHMTVPGPINFHQPVNRWVIERG